MRLKESNNGTRIPICDRLRSRSLAIHLRIQKEGHFFLDGIGLYSRSFYVHLKPPNSGVTKT